MLDKILSLKEGNNSVNEFCNALRQGIPSAIFGVNEPFKSYLVGAVSDKVLLVVKDNITAWFSAELIKDYSGKKVVIVPAKDEVLLTNKAFSKERQHARLIALSQVKTADVVIATPEALMQYCPKNIAEFSISLDQELTRETAIKTLVDMGYVRVESVEGCGTFSVRGDMLDVFPINKENPCRIEFFGDNVENIKQFDVDTRKNLGRINLLNIISAVEFAFTD